MWHGAVISALVALQTVPAAAPVHDLVAGSGNVYAAAAGDCDFDCRGKILVFRRDRTTGELSSSGEVDAEAQSLALSRDGRSLYSAGGLEIQAFARDRATGSLTARARACERARDAPGCKGRGFGGGEGLPGIDVAVSPDGRNVYGTSTWGETVMAFRSSLAQLPGARGCLTDLRYDGCGVFDSPPFNAPGEVVLVNPDGKLVLTGGAMALSFKRDPASGALSHPRRICSCGYAGSVSFAPSGMAYIVGGTLYAFHYDRRHGRLVQLRGPGSCASPRTKGCVRTPALRAWTGATLSGDGRSIYLVSNDSTFVTTLRRDRRTGRVSAPTTVDPGIGKLTALAARGDSVYVGSKTGVAMLGRR